MSKNKTTATKKKFQPLVLNKKNAQAFADNIFYDKGGRVSFLKLCEGDLSDGKDDGRTLHCALGEAYFVFVDTNVAGFVKQMEKKYKSSIQGERYDDELGEWVPDEKSYQPKYAGTDNCDHTGTVAVVDVLCDRAQLKNNSFESKKKLAAALLKTMQSNDDACGLDMDVHMERARDVAETWRKKVIPLLK